jgi:hypothetical protein
MQSEMAKALQTPFAPLTELARKSMEAWEQMQAATRNAFAGSAAETSSAANKDEEKPRDESKKGT